MITMEMLGKVRRPYSRDKKSLHETAKSTGLSRNTIRKWERDTGDVAKPTYRRSEVPSIGLRRHRHHHLVKQGVFRSGTCCIKYEVRTVFPTRLCCAIADRVADISLDSEIEGFALGLSGCAHLNSLQFMAEPLADGGEVHPRLEQMDSRGVAQGMRVNPFASQCRSGVRRRCDVLP